MSSLAIVDLAQIQREVTVYTNIHGHIAGAMCFQDIMGFMAWLASRYNDADDIAYEIQQMVWEEYGEDCDAREVESLLHRCWFYLGDTLCEAVGGTGQYAIWDGYEDEESGRFKIERVIM